MIKVFGLKNCDTCRKALKWLTENDLDHQFVDLRKDGVFEADLTRWTKAAGWETLLNRRGTTWRGLNESEKESIDEARALKLMAIHPALIKRPVFDLDGTVIVGFKEEQKSILSNSG